MGLLIRFYEWLEQLSGAMAAVVGALIAAVLIGLFRKAILPFLKWIFTGIGRILYPVVSGAVVIDRLISLRRYLKSLEQTVGLLKTPGYRRVKGLAISLCPFLLYLNTIPKSLQN